MTTSWDMVIDGQTTAAADAPTYERHHPSTGHHVGSFREGDFSHVDLAVASARRAFQEDGWGVSTGAERATILTRLAERLRQRSEEYARWESDQVGIPYGQVSWLNSYCADVVDFYAGAARMHYGRSIELSEERLGLTLQQPMGVVGVITPFNFPLVLTIWKVAAAIAAGCTLVVKPAAGTPITVIELACDLLDVGLPPGVCNVVTGKGSVIGEAIVDHPDVNKVAFTGSTATGQRVMQRASITMKRVSLELGGKSPLIVMPDADPDAAATAALECFFNAGQQCNVPSRLLLQQGSNTILDQVVERAQDMRLGADDDADMGPLFSESALESVMSHVDGARSAGAKILTGGSATSEVGPGPFLPPTIIDEVDSTAKIVSEEVFGPVMVVQHYEDLDHAISVANDGDFGLAAGIFTADLDAAMKASRRLKAGLVWVNTWNSTVPELPTGGTKGSGMGRELGMEGMFANLETKTVLIDPAGAL